MKAFIFTSFILSSHLYFLLIFVLKVQTLSLVIVTFTYLLVGAAIFDALEGTNNENALEGLIKVKYYYFSLWAVENLNSNRTFPVCTGLPDNSVYLPDDHILYSTSP